MEKSSFIFFHYFSNENTHTISYLQYSAVFSIIKKHYNKKGIHDRTNKAKYYSIVSKTIIFRLLFSFNKILKIFFPFNLVWISRQSTFNQCWQHYWIKLLNTLIYSALVTYFYIIITQKLLKHVLRSITDTLCNSNHDGLHIGIKIQCAIIIDNMMQYNC